MFDNVAFAVVIGNMQYEFSTWETLSVLLILSAICFAAGAIAHRYINNGRQ
jgi:hypothetical protein